MFCYSESEKAGWERLCVKETINVLTAKHTTCSSAFHSSHDLKSTKTGMKVLNSMEIMNLKVWMLSPSKSEIKSQHISWRHPHGWMNTHHAKTHMIFRAPPPPPIFSTLWPWYVTKISKTGIQLQFHEKYYEAKWGKCQAVLFAVQTDAS